MKRALSMQSGGKDGEYVYDKFTKEKPDVPVDIFFIATEVEFRNHMIQQHAKSKKRNLNTLEYADTRNAISGINSGATIYWGFECHLRAIQYALENGYDGILSGHTNYAVNRTDDDSDEFEMLFSDLQDLLEVSEKHKVEVCRPVRSIISRDERFVLYEGKDPKRLILG